MLRALPLCLALLAALVTPSAAAAQGTVSFRLEVPPGFGRVEVTAVRLLAAGVEVGNASIHLVSEGGSSFIAIGIPVAATPDTAEVDYVSGDAGGAGLPTLYRVTGAALAFDTPYALPTPSPGGTIGPQPAVEGDAVFRLLLPRVPPPRTDFTPPTCAITMPERGLLEARIQDTGSGLERIDVFAARNLEVETPAFTPGTTDPVIVSARVVDPQQTTILLLRAVDAELNGNVCKRIMRQSGRMSRR